jgi:hypothetical protein
MKDEIIDEIRKIRSQLDKKMRSNPKKYNEEIKKLEKDNRSRIVSGRPKYKKPKAA